MTGNRTAAVVLAGGAARRMGGIDKPLLTVGNRSMLAAVIAALQQHPSDGNSRGDSNNEIPRAGCSSEVQPIAISANGDPSRFAAFNLPVLPDGAFHGQGPLAGLLAGLEWAAALGITTLLTAPADTPFLPRGLASWLAPAPACVASAGRRHHLIALWPVDCAAALRTLLSRPGPRSVGYFAGQIGMRYADYEVRTDDAFANINTPEDLANARTIARHAIPRGGTDLDSG